MPNPEPTVLCVDDEPGIRSALRRIFLEEPWEILFAESGMEGLEIVRQRPIDLVLSDYRMPGMNGVEFLKKTKEIQPDCVRVVLSGYADIDVIVSALNEGEIYRFIPKPWNPGELLDMARKALEHQRLRQENEQLRAEAERKVMRRTERLHRAQTVLERLPLPLLGLDGDGCVFYANARARDLLGDEVVGAPAPPAWAKELGSAPGDEPAAVLPVVLEDGTAGAVVLDLDKDIFEPAPPAPVAQGETLS